MHLTQSLSRYRRGRMGRPCEITVTIIHNDDNNNDDNNNNSISYIE